MGREVKIIAHTLVKNEQRWIWYSLNSVLDYIDQIMVWDTGSSDRTVEIIKTIKSPKIKFTQAGTVDENSFTQVRQKMLDSTPTDFHWLMILDGDEIWPRESIKTATDFARRNLSYESIVVRTNNLVGDIYHRLPESTGMYHLAGRIGHLNLRFINLKAIPGLHAAKPHGQQGYFDAVGKLIQDRDPQKIKFLDVYYHHATHLQRSTSRQLDLATVKRAQKLKFELGGKMSRDQIPEIFFEPHPAIVPDVTSPASLSFWLKSLLLTIPKRVKRTLLAPKHGY